MKNHIKQTETYLRHLVRYRSVTGNKLQCDAIINYVLHSLPVVAKSKRYECNGVKSLVVALNEKSLKKATLCFHAHLDVVDGSNAQFQLKKTGDFYTGRGVYDMKGSAAVFLSLLNYYAQIKQYPDVQFLFTTDEEAGGSNGTQFVLSQGIKSRFVITGEPTNLKIGTQAKGAIWVKVRTKGIPEHGAYLMNGKNAVVELIKKMKTILSLNTA